MERLNYSLQLLNYDLGCHQEDICRIEEKIRKETKKDTKEEYKKEIKKLKENIKDLIVAIKKLKK